MKKVYILSLSLIISGIGLAQRVTSTVPWENKLSELPAEAFHVTSETNAQDRASGDTIWIDYFDVATDWTAAGPGTPPDNGWSIGSTVNGWYFGTSGGMGTSGDFARFSNSDGTGPTNGVVENGPFTLTYNNAIDLTGVPGPQFRFEQYGARFITIQAVEVSVDGGSTWTEVGNNSDIPPLTSTGGSVYGQPETRSYHLTDAIAADPSNVMVRFSWNGDMNGSSMNYVDYGWFVDNPRIVEGNTYDVQCNTGYVGDIFNDWEYTDIPQAQAGLLTCSAEVYNNGYQLPTNLGLEVTVYDPSMTQIHQSTGGAVLNPPFSIGVTDLLVYSTPFDMSSLAVGNYTVRMVTTYDETDEVPSNDTTWRTFNITANFMSHVDYEQSFAYTDWYNAGAGITDGFEYGAAFGMTNNGDLHGLDIFIGPNSDVGAEIYVNIYEWPDLSSDPVFLDGPYTYDITSSMIGQWSTLNLHQAKYETYNPITMFGGSVYVVTVVVDAGVSCEYRANALDDDFSGQFLYYGDGLWYWAGDEPWVGLNFDQTLGIESKENHNFTIGQNYPNPFDNTSVISYSLEEASNVSITFTDLSGKVISTLNQGTQAPGAYQLEVNGDDFAEGVYFYTFTIGDVKITKKMTVTK